MSDERAQELHKELEGMLGEAPGPLEGTRGRLRAIEFEFRSLSGVTAYTREKLGEATEYLSIWLSDRRWQSYGPDPTRLRHQTLLALSKLRDAIRADLGACRS